MKYAIHILTIKQWEYEGSLEKWDMEIKRNGPDDTVCKFYNDCAERIKEIKEAIRILANYNE